MQPLNVGSTPLARALLPDPARTVFRVNPATGLFGGTFLHPGTGRRTPLHGAILQKQSLGAGAFCTDRASGGVSLAPK